MKKYLLILIVAIFCLPNEGFAQLTTWEKEAKAQHRRDHPFSGKSEEYQSAKKPKVKIPARDIHRAIDVVTNDTTGVITARWDDGSTYIGEIYYGELKGTGTLTLADGGKYHGQWRFDRFHGVGTMEYADGGKYIGQWSWGKPHGQGTIVEPNGVKITAKFDEGIPRGKCIIQDVDGRLYTGRWSSGILLKKSIKPLEEK